MNGRVLFKHLFNRVGVNVLTSANKHVVNTADKEVPAILVAVHQIASAVPTIGQPFSISFREFVVPEHHAFRFHPQLALIGFKTANWIDELELDVLVLIPERNLWARKIFGMRSELQDSFCRSVSVSH